MRVTIKSKIFRLVFGVLLLSALIYYVDARHISNTLLAMEKKWVIYAGVLIVCATLIGAVNTHLFIDLEGNIPFSRFLSIYWLSWAAGLIFPGQVGDMASLAVLLQRRGVSFSTSIGRVLVDKIISLILTLGFASFAVINNKSLPILDGFAVGIAVMVWLLYWHRVRLIKWLRERQSRVAVFMVSSLREAMQVGGSHPWRILLNGLLTVTKISFIGSSYWCAFHALGYHDLSLFKLTSLVAISSLVAYIPISFNGIGVVEALGMAVFASVGIVEADVLSAYLVLRAITLIIAWGPAAMWLMVNRDYRLA